MSRLEESLWVALIPQEGTGMPNGQDTNNSAQGVHTVHSCQWIPGTSSTIRDKVQLTEIWIYTSELPWSWEQREAIPIFILSVPLTKRWKNISSFYEFRKVQVLVTQLCPALCNSMGYSKQKYWSESPFPSPGDLPKPGIEPRSPALQVDSLPSEPPGKPFMHSEK